MPAIGGKWNSCRINIRMLQKSSSLRRPAKLIQKPMKIATCENADSMAALWGKCPVRLGYGTLRIYHAMLLSGRLHQYEGNVGFVCRCWDKGAGFFQNWEEMMESYLLGGQFWKHEDQSNPNSMTAERWKLYEQLWQGRKPFQSSPYLAVPFDQPLSKEVITNEYGILPEYQKYYNHWIVRIHFGYGKGAACLPRLVGGVRFSVSGWTKCPEVGRVVLFAAFFFPVT